MSNSCDEAAVLGPARAQRDEARATAALPRDVSRAALKPEGVTTSFTLSRMLRPQPTLTPAAADPRVSQANTRSTVCAHDYTKTIRPPAKLTGDLKRRRIAKRWFADRHRCDYEKAHP